MRMLWFACKLLLLVGVTLVLAAQAGSVDIIWQGQAISTSLAVFALLALGFVLLILAVYRCWRFLIESWQRRQLKRRLNGLEKGQEALSLALTALAAGNPDDALRMTHQARKKLGITPMGLMVQAQAAYATGDQTLAEKLFRQLLARDDGAILGLRGLLTLAQKKQDWDQIEQLIALAREKNIQMPWLSTVTYRLALHKGNWDEANRALSYAVSARQLPQDSGIHQQAALQLAEAKCAEQEGRIKAARDHASEAVRLQPDWLPAVLYLADLELRTGHQRAASKLVERYWQSLPHPDWAELYRQVYGEETALAFYQRVQKLVRHDQNDPVALRWLAAVALDADLWGEARRCLLQLINGRDAMANDYHLLSRLERRESGDEQSAAQWLTKAATANPDPRWICADCGTAIRDWQPVCSHCHAFASIDWSGAGGRVYHKPDLAVASATLLPLTQHV